MNDHDERNAVVTVAGMARKVGLSRQRFYQLIGTTFPCPIYVVTTRRPFYPKDLQEICLEVRKRNCGIDGRPVLFYAKRREIAPNKPRRYKRKPMKPQHADLLDGLRSLGMVNVTTVQIGAAVKRLFPSGVNGTDQGDVLRAVFLHLKRQN